MINNKNIFAKGEMGQVAAVFCIQASSTTAFAVFYSGLLIYLTNNQSFSTKTATLITSIFLSMNYFLPIIGGFISHRVITYKNLYSLGGMIGVIGCLILANTNYLYFGLASFLMSSMVSKVCVNMFITQLFPSDDIAKRRKAFVCSYVGSNLGFMLGFLLTGYCTLVNNYVYLFYLMSFLLSASVILSIFFINEQKPHPGMSKNAFRQFSTSAVIMGLIITIVTLLFYKAAEIHSYITFLSLLLFFALIHYSFKNSSEVDKKKLVTFFGYSVLTIAFFTVYMLTPLAMMHIIEQNVQRNIFGLLLAPQWLINIDSIVILVVFPSLAFFSKRTNRDVLFTMKTTSYYLFGYLFAIGGILFLVAGLNLLDASSKIPLLFMLCYLVFFTLAEMMIAPIGDSLIGELIPQHLRGIMTGSWSMNLAIAGLLSSIVANRLLMPYIGKGAMAIQNNQNLQHSLILICCSLFAFVFAILITSKFIKQPNKSERYLNENN